MRMPARVAALESRTPISTTAMDPAEALALWLAMEGEEAEPDPSWIGLTAHQAWVKYQDCLNG